jgi:hypothetical protein
MVCHTAVRGILFCTLTPGHIVTINQSKTVLLQQINMLYGRLQFPVSVYKPCYR